MIGSDSRSGLIIGDFSPDFRRINPRQTGRILNSHSLLVANLPRINSETRTSLVKKVSLFSSTSQHENDQESILKGGIVSPGARLMPDCFHDLSQWTH